MRDATRSRLLPGAGLPRTGEKEQSTHLLLVSAALDIVFRRLAEFSSASPVDELYAEAREHLAEVESWRTSPPIRADRDRIMACVLKLHNAVRRMEQQGQEK
jgi:hypothetical protein